MRVCMSVYVCVLCSAWGCDQLTVNKWLRVLSPVWHNLLPSNKHCSFIKHLYLLWGHASWFLLYLPVKLVLFIFLFVNASLSNTFFIDQLYRCFSSDFICFALETPRGSFQHSWNTQRNVKSTLKAGGEGKKKKFSCKQFWVKCVDTACLAHSHFACFLKHGRSTQPQRWIIDWLLHNSGLLCKNSRPENFLALFLFFFFF